MELEKRTEFLPGSRAKITAHSSNLTAPLKSWRERTPGLGPRDTEKQSSFLRLIEKDKMGPFQKEQL